VSRVTSRTGHGNGTTITPVAVRSYEQRGATVVMQILVVSVVAVIFLVRLTVALYDRPSRQGNQDG
jgi:hypothetical protein